MDGARRFRDNYSLHVTARRFGNPIFLNRNLRSVVRRLRTQPKDTGKESKKGSVPKIESVPFNNRKINDAESIIKRLLLKKTEGSLPDIAGNVEIRRQHFASFVPSSIDEDLPEHVLKASYDTKSKVVASLVIWKNTENLDETVRAGSETYGFRCLLCEVTMPSADCLRLHLKRACPQNCRTAVWSIPTKSKDIILIEFSSSTRNSRPVLKTSNIYSSWTFFRTENARRKALNKILRQRPSDLLTKNLDAYSRRLTNILSYFLKQYAEKNLQSDDLKRSNKKSSQFQLGVKFHTGTNAPWVNDDGSDSDHAPDETWLEVVEQKRLAALENVSYSAMQFISLWNGFLRREESGIYLPGAQFLVPAKVIIFAEKYAKELKEKRLTTEFLCHCFTLYEFGLIEARTIEEAVGFIHNCN